MPCSTDSYMKWPTAYGVFCFHVQFALLIIMITKLSTSWHQFHLLLAISSIPCQYTHNHKSRLHWSLLDGLPHMCYHSLGASPIWHRGCFSPSPDTPACCTPASPIVQLWLEVPAREPENCGIFSIRLSAVIQWGSLTMHNPHARYSDLRGHPFQLN